jgi:hypothetical protein
MMLASARCEPSDAAARENFRTVLPIRILQLCVPTHSHLKQLSPADICSLLSVLVPIVESENVCKQIGFC